MRVKSPNYARWLRTGLWVGLALSLVGYRFSDIVSGTSVVYCTLITIPLIAVTYLEDPLSLVLAMTLAVFFLGRALLLPFVPGNFTYPLVTVDMTGLTDALYVLLIATWSLLAGSAIGAGFVSKCDRLEPSHVLPFQGWVLNRRLYYRTIVRLYVATVIPLTLLRLVTGVGIAGTNDLIVSKASGYAFTALSLYVSFLGVTPILWRLRGEPSQRDRVLTVTGIIMYFAFCVLSFSKAALMYAALPAICVWFAYYEPIPPRLFKVVAVLAVLTLFLGGPLSSLRASLRSRIVAGEMPGLPLGSVLDDPGDRNMIGDLAKRVGSSFDVLYSVVNKKADFLPHLDGRGEMASFVNTLVPGRPLDVGTYEHPATVLPKVLRGLSDESLLGHGENINVINFLYLYGGVVGLAAGLLAGGFILALLYGRLRSLTARVFVLTMSISWLSNGGNLGDFAREVRPFFVSFLTAVLLANTWSWLARSTRKHPKPKTQPALAKA